MEIRDDLYYVEEVLKGNTSSFSFLVDRHKDLVYTIALKIAGNREDAEEIAQDVFVKAFQKLDSFRRDAKFSTWLYRIAYNESITRVRKKKHEYNSLDDSALENIPDQAIQEGYLGLEVSEQMMIVARIFEMLTEEEYTLVTLFYMQSVPVDEISSIMGLSVSNVKVKLHRLRKRVYGSMGTIMNQQNSSIVQI